MELEYAGRVTVARASDGGASALRDFERLAELLRLDAVGVATAGDAETRIVWWGAPGTAFPERVDELLSGRTPGWMAAPLPDGSTVFARITSRSSVRTPAVLQAIGPVLAASVGTAPFEERELETGTVPGTALEAALGDLRDDLGFETVSLFVRGATGWELLARRGPIRPWHAVLDPAALEGTPEAAEYPDVLALPGMGGRLAGLGCASMASIPVPTAARILLDSSVPCPEGGWIERSRPFLALLSIMAGPAWSAGGALRAFQEVEILSRVFTTVQDIVVRPGATTVDLLEDVREALGAGETFLLSERGGEIDVLASPAGSWPLRLPPDVRTALIEVEPGRAELPDALVDELARALAIPSKAVAGALGREGGSTEAFLAGWTDGLELSPVSMAVVAGAVSSAQAALLGRRRALTALVDRERTRMAYALHDGIVQTVTSAVLELEALRKRFERDPEDALSTLESSKAEIRRSLAELRSVLFDLSRSSTEGHRAAEPIARYVEDVVRRWRLPAWVTVEGNVDDVPARVLSVAYVVIREALANAAKYAGAGKVSVSLSAIGGELSVSVFDGGRGFTSEDERAAREAHHFGLDMLRRRVREAGGRLTVESTPGRGTEVLARIPIREERR